MFPSRRSAVILSVAAAALFLGACSGKPENSPVIRKKFAELDELKQQINDTNQNVRSMAGDVTIIKDEISNLRAMAPDASGGSELVRRLEDIERRLGTVNEGNRVVASNTVQPTANVSGNGAFGELAVPKPPANQIAAATTANPAEAKPSFPGLRQAPKPTEVKTTKAPAPTKASTPRGSYYTIQAGDSLDKIAADNKISVNDLRKANSLPSGARPLKGQRLFIPGK